MSNAMRDRIDREPAFKPGDVVRWKDKWGVCAGYRFAGIPLWDFFDEFGDFVDQIGSVDPEISAPYRHDYGHIPDTVLAKATAYKLTENL